MARVNKGSYSFTCQPRVYPQVQWTIPAFNPQAQSIATLWLVLISHTAEGRRLSWPGWLVTVTIVSPALQKRLNWMRCRLDCALGWAQGTMYCITWGFRFPMQKGIFEGGEGWPIVKYRDCLLWLKQSRCRLGCGLEWVQGSMCWVYIGATWWIQLNSPSAAAMWPFCRFTYCYYYHYDDVMIAFSALNCLFGIRKSIRSANNWVLRCWLGYVTVARCNNLHAVQMMPLPPHNLLLH